MTKLKVHICMVIPKIKIQDIPETKVNYISKYTVHIHRFPNFGETIQAVNLLSHCKQSFNYRSNIITKTSLTDKICVLTQSVSRSTNLLSLTGLSLSLPRNFLWLHRQKLLWYLINSFHKL